MEILIVDDSETVRSFVREILTGFNANITEAGDGVKAFGLIARNIYDLIFMDIEIPGKSGLDVIKRVRTILGYKYTPIIVMTGLQKQDLIQKAFDVGASDYITKPLSEVEILARSRTLLENRNLSRELSLASRSKSDFISRLAHELRDPLNAINGFAEFIERKSEHKQVLEACNFIHQASTYLEELISDAKNLGQIEAGVIELEHSDVPFDLVLKEIHDLVIPLSTEKSCKLLFPQRRDCKFTIRADKKRLKEILLNLMTNAIKYNQAQGEVQLLVETFPDKHIRLGVKDTGKGIPDKDIPRIFEPFNRLGAEKNGVQGTGIGLALTRKYVELMEGDLIVDSHPGQGTTFWVDLKKTYILD